MEIPEPIEAWGIATRDVPDRGLKVSHKANETERALLAGIADVESVEEFVFDYTLKADRGQSFRLSGTLRARVIQPCVLTLDPVTSVIDEDFACRFGSAPREKAQPAISNPGITKTSIDKPGEDKPILEVEDWERIENGRLDIGRILTETFVAAIDPFPRKDGASFEWAGSGGGKGKTGADGASQDGSDAGDAERENPFAVLAKLKQKDTE